MSVACRILRLLYFVDNHSTNEESCLKHHSIRKKQKTKNSSQIEPDKPSKVPTGYTAFIRKHAK